MDGSFLRFYVHENDRLHGRLAWEWLLKQANGLGVRGGSAFRAVAGFGRHHVLHEERFFELAGTVTVEVEFIVTDGPQEIRVRYVGILPDLFREGQGVIARGALNEAGLFEASEVLAKHDENYMPPEVKKSLEARGVKLGESASHPDGSKK